MQIINSWKVGDLISRPDNGTKLHRRAWQALRDVLAIAAQGTARSTSSYSGLTEYHRARLIINRVRVAMLALSLVMLVVAAADFAVLPTGAATVLLRGILLGGLALTILAAVCRCSPSTGQARLAIGLLFAISATIFLFSNQILIRAHLAFSAYAISSGCFFVPLALLALMTFFPFTLSELLLLTLPPLLIFAVGRVASTAPIIPACSDSLLLVILILIGLIAGAGSLGQTCLMRAMLHRSLRDPLTSTLNRLSGELVLQMQLARAKRDGSPISVAFLDIDNFKQINDQLGHQAGDMVLRGMADRLRMQIRGRDVLIRWAGDEFLLVMPGAHAEDGAKRLRFLTGDPSLPQISGKPITWSYGVAEWPHDSEDDSWQTLVMAADEQMYNAKRKGASGHYEMHCPNAKRQAAAIN